ncbi:MAG: CBS domain-containing protein [Bifidobacteriaceae bacterium]|jgi:flagellar motility protein MotE (MotC chaperone)|nr:CBS domain-containing protein [Bifidobacteriaceae bacterium]
MQVGTLAYVLRLTDKTVFDPIGESLGKVRDFVLHSTGANQMVCVGMVVDVLTRKRIFVPMSRVLSVKPGQIVIDGVLNMRRFKQQKMETLAVSDLLDRQIKMRDEDGRAYIQDIALELQKDGDWLIKKLYVKIEETGSQKSLFSTQPKFYTKIIDIDDVISLRHGTEPQSATTLLEEWEDYKPADIAEILMGMPFKRRAEIVGQLTDEKFADVMEELPETEQARLIEEFDIERAADIVESMQPDDAADLLAKLPQKKSEELLDTMQPEDADDVKQLLKYNADSAGGLMTTDCIILAPEVTVSEALAHIRQEEIPPAVASLVLVTRAPNEVPTGRFIGVAHFQALLRVPPHQPIGEIVDTDAVFVYPEDSVDEVSRVLATYDQMSIPVLSHEHKLLGAISVDDVLDHILPENWRGYNEHMRVGDDIKAGADGK